VASRGQARAVELAWTGATYSRRRAWTARGPPADGGAHALAWAGAGGGARVLAWACAVEPATRESHGLSFGGRGCRLAARGGEERRLARRKETFGANVCFLSGMMGNFLQLYQTWFWWSRATLSYSTNLVNLGQIHHFSGLDPRWSGWIKKCLARKTGFESVLGESRADGALPNRP